MCNLYNMTTNREAMVRLFRADIAPELPLDLPKIYPDRDAPVVSRDEAGARAASLMRWGFPPPPKGRAPVTNVRNLTSPFWRAWLKKPYRCLVPMTAFSENDRDRKPHWFTLGETPQLAAFAGIWRPWAGERLTAVAGKARRERREGEWRLFAFLTTEPNAEVAPIHEKAMPVVLRTPEECDIWLDGEDAQVLALARPLEDGALRVSTEP